MFARGLTALAVLFLLGMCARPARAGDSSILIEFYCSFGSEDAGDELHVSSEEGLDPGHWADGVLYFDAWYTSNVTPPYYYQFSIVVGRNSTQTDGGTIAVDSLFDGWASLAAGKPAGTWAGHYRYRWQVNHYPNSEYPNGVTSLFSATYYSSTRTPGI